ncbi:hypothetical protein KI385_15480 [Streptomyces inhibens]|nr:hypothetical protein KI385_15480 [Streptomyces inhibens]
MRTTHTGIEKRHLPGATSGGGYDLAVEPPKRGRGRPRAVGHLLSDRGGIVSAVRALSR